MKLNKKSIFLFDGIGAALSTALLGLVLPALDKLVGMPIPILYILACFAFSYMIFSFSCFFWANHQNPGWLKVIICANLFHCFLTIVFLAIYHSEIKALGFIYFVVETIVVLGVVQLERKILTEVSVS